MLIGIAIGEGAIKSVDDTAQTYVPGFKDTEYGKTPIRDLLHMSSGVEFGETKAGQRDLNRLWIDMVLGLGPTKGTISSIVQFNRRIAAPGTKYFYASIEADVLGVVLHYAVSQSASGYLREKLWEPIGAEADAAWMVDAQGFEVAHGFFNAVLRDYARLGRLLAHDGVWEGRQIISGAIHDRRDDDAPVVRRLSCARQGHVDVWLWLFPVAASGRPTPVRARRRQRPAHLRRSDFGADHGSDGCREYRRGLASMVGTGRAARPRIMPYGAPSNGICQKTCSVGYTGFRDDRARPRASKIDSTNSVLALL
jgi:CubicO group peptidase (beta-lactamase class C family)